MVENTGRRPATLAALALGLGLVAACAERQPTAVAVPPAAADHPRPLFVAGDAVEKDWRKFRIWREAEFSLVALDGEVAIGAVAEGASAGLARRVEIDPDTCPEIEWSWRVDRLPGNAELSSRSSEDVAASLIVAFGDPGVFANPDPVPTLRYVWATTANAVGEVVESPYFPEALRTVVVRSGAEGVGQWFTERRDLRADYERAFGEPPEDRIEVIALFTDSDHGSDRVEAFYRWARVLCTAPEEPPSIF